MLKLAAGHGRQIAAGLALMALSFVPYATVYLLERISGAPNAAASALWPTVAAPVLVGTWLAVTLLRGRSPRAVAVRPLES